MLVGFTTCQLKETETEAQKVLARFLGGFSGSHVEQLGSRNICRSWATLRQFSCVGVGLNNRTIAHTVPYSRGPYYNILCCSTKPSYMKAPYDTLYTRTAEPVLLLVA